MQCVVEPGVNVHYLNSQVLIPKYGLFLGVDPAPAACIGGMVGTCCSGPSAFQYGTMLNQVINLTLVLWDGTVIKTGQRAVKSVAGYNLNGLFVGSEGTLGIVTEITLRLRAVPKWTEIAQAYFDDMVSVAKCQNDILQSGIQLAAFEFLDNVMVTACQDYNPKGIQSLIRNKHLMIFKFAGPSKKHIHADIECIQEIVKKYSKYPFIFSTDEQERKRLWNTRKAAFWAAKAINNSKDVIITDVAVPYSNLGDILVKVKKELDASPLVGPIIAHIGDGNFHSCLLYDNKNVLEIAEAKRLCNFIVDLALQLEGTCTAEHGVGLRKKEYLFKEFGNHTVQFMSNLKHFIDPIGIFNPGKIVD
ncbi:D-lactate dehydrogenase, mitochondrial precursor [Reticulomyxa filosa]|uniref:D-lactate dehydrogenase (cytochrome) n=1 Tax=Reticulomyxa filosa TaxID=46433 RepID=X6MV62_RETFI|nr:D-lactate dehydrogenase, mitochondrial precursor [Reticulomyxa filosa]|eukprot:ETO17531.1 D-lactate dehydrogenase, mitochondrial precursor [Reticulomyxa filosa]